MSRSLRDLRPGQYRYLGGGVYAYRGEKGVRYGIQYRENGKLKRRMVGNKESAERALARAKVRVDERKVGLPERKGIPTFFELCDDFLEYAKGNKRSWKRDAGVLQEFKRHFEDKPIDLLTAQEIEGYRRKRIQDVSKSSVNREIAILRKMYNTPFARRYVVENPTAGVSMYKEPEHVVRTLNDAQKAALIESCPDHLRRIVIAALYAGLRRGEILDLDWEDVNFDQGVITVKRSKSGRVRHVPMAAIVHNTLAEIAQEKGRVFTYEGRPISTIRRSFATAIRNVNKKADEDKAAGRPEIRIGRCRFHDLRHTFVTDLFLRGGNPADIQKLAGHADIKTTMRYAHPSPESMRNTINLLDKVETSRYCIRNTPEGVSAGSS